MAFPYPKHHFFLVLCIPLYSPFLGGFIKYSLIWLVNSPTVPLRESKSLFILSISVFVGRSIVFSFTVPLRESNSLFISSISVFVGRFIVFRFDSFTVFLRESNSLFISSISVFIIFSDFSRVG